jgi:hypothetical protein
MNQSCVSFSRYLTYGAVLLVAACASEKQQIPPQAASGLTEVRADAVKLKQELSRTSDSARTLSTSSASDVPRSVDSLSGNLNDLKGTLAQGRSAVNLSEDQVATYFANWDKQTQATWSTSASGEMKKASQKQQAEAAASFQSLRASIYDVRKNIWPYVSDLSTVEMYVRRDYTEASVNAQSSRLSGTIAQEPVIQRDLDSVIAQIDAIQGVNK